MLPLRARHIRMATEKMRETEERERLLAEKTRPAREAAEAERRERAEQHRLRALEPLADRLAGVVFDVIERDRVVIRAHLAEALHSALLRSGLWRDPRWPQPPPG
jgi:hypothetical protein